MPTSARILPPTINDADKENPMNILVLNGSPKGENSITLQTVRYLEKLCPHCTFEVIHVGQRIKSIEKNFAPCAEALKQADLLL